MIIRAEPSAPPDEPKKLLAVAVSSTKPIDTEEYYNTLKNYWIHGWSYPAKQSAPAKQRSSEAGTRDIQRRNAILEKNVLFGEGDPNQKLLMARLLCGYQILLAEVASEHGFYQEAKDYLINAFTLACEKKLYDFQGIVLVRRHILLFRAGFDPILGDFATGEQLKSLIAPQIYGRLLTTESARQAHLAQDQSTFDAALSVSDKAETLIGSISSEDYHFFTGLNKGCYLLDRAVTLVESPIKALRSPNKAQEFLDLAMEENNARGKKGKSVKAYNQIDYDLIQARIYCDQGYHPVAATTTEQVLITLNHIQSKVGLHKIAALFKEVKEQNPYGVEVMSLELALMEAQQPYLFHG